MKTYALSKQKNIRDLGGLKGYHHKKIKYGHIFRGGVLNKVNEEDVKIIDSFHLTDIVDFRAEREFIERPDYRFDGVSYHNFMAIKDSPHLVAKLKEDGNLLWFVSEDDTGFNHLRKQYISLVSDEFSLNAYRKFFKLLQEDNKVIYFHCSQGKDRAGLAAFFIEMALGVSMDDAIDDYLLTNVAMDEKIDRLIKQVEDKPFYNKEYEKSLRAVFSAKMEYLNAAIDTINEKYGNMDNFLRNILYIDIERLRELYLE